MLHNELNKLLLYIAFACEFYMIITHSQFAQEILDWKLTFIKTSRAKFKQAKIHRWTRLPMTCHIMHSTFVPRKQFFNWPHQYDKFHCAFQHELMLQECPENNTIANELDVLDKCLQKA